MRNRLIVAATFLAIGSSSAFAQQASKPGPQMGPAVSIALGALEKQKSDAKDAFTKAEQEEQAIFQEFAQQHPGFMIDPSNLTVTEIPAPQKQPNAPASSPQSKK